MKALPFLILTVVLASCADIPELDGVEPRGIQKAAYPRLIPLQDTLGAPVDPVSEAEEVEEDLTTRSEALKKKAEALQNAETN